MKSKIKIFFMILMGVVILFFGAIFSESGAKGILVNAEETQKDVLFIGNSMTYYNTLCNVVQGIARRKGHNIKCSAATNGGKDLIYNAKADNVVTAIKKGGYEVVVLQDIVGSFDSDRLMEGAGDIISVIKKYNPNAQIIFYEPWPIQSTLTGKYSMLPYFTDGYVQAAKKFQAQLDPVGESFYDIYVNHGLNYYCKDGKHPQPLGTFTAAATIYYTLYNETFESFTETDQTYLNQLINNNVAFTTEGKKNTYSLNILNLIMERSHYYADIVREVMTDKTGSLKYTSVAGEYVDPDVGMNPDNLVAVTGTETDKMFFQKSKGNLAVGCKAYASNEFQPAKNVVDGNEKTRWETEYFNPQWIYVDLGVETEIRTVGFMWEGAYASKYYIQVSDDAKQWKTVAYVTARSKKTVRVTLDKAYKTRFVRMYGTRRGTNYGYSLYEIGIWKDGTSFVVPKIKVQKTKIKSAIKKKKSTKAKIKLKKIKGASGYQIKIGITKKLRKSRKISFKKNTFTVKKLRGKKQYYLKVRVYKVSDGVRHYSKWSGIKRIKIKKQ